MPTIPIMVSEPFGGYSITAVTVPIPAGEYASAMLHVIAEPVQDFTDRKFGIAANDVEIARFVTPMGATTPMVCDVDVTRFLKLFTGSVEFKVNLGNPATVGWRVTLTLTLTEGVPPTTPNYIPLLLWHMFRKVDPDIEREITIPANIPNGVGFIAISEPYGGTNEMYVNIDVDGVYLDRITSLMYHQGCPALPIYEVNIPFSCNENIRVYVPAEFGWGSRSYSGQWTSLAAVILEEPPLQHLLTIESSTFGTTNPLPGEYLIVEGSEVTVTPVPNAGYTFDYWDLNGEIITDDPITFIMDSPKLLAPHFREITATQYVLTVATTIGGDTNPSPGDHAYDEGTIALITAIPDTGYSFTRWELDGVHSSVNPIPVTMDQNHILNAVFTAEVPPPTYTLTITASIGGTTTPLPGVYSGYEEGTTENVSATADADYVFSHWQLNGIDVGNVNPYTVTMDADHILHAVFVAIVVEESIVQGVVTDNSGNPIVAATAEVNGYSIQTDGTGFFSLTIPVGAYTLTISKIGYLPVTELVDVTTSDIYTFDATLTELAQQRWCFIATATYKTPFAPQINILRRFRNQCLPNPITRLYYKLSPPLADYITQHPKARRVSQHILEPIIKMVRHLLS